MAEFLPFAWPVATGLTVSVVVYLVRKVIDTDAKLSAHFAADLVTFEAIDENLKDLKGGQRDTNQKLDRLLEHLLTTRGPSA